MSQDLNVDDDVAANASAISNIINEMIICIKGKQLPEVHDLEIAELSKMVAANNLFIRDSNMLTERECVQKILKLLSARKQEDGKTVSDYFHELYSKLTLINCDPHMRHSLMTHLLSMADNSDDDKSSANEDPRTQCDNLTQILVRRLDLRSSSSSILNEMELVNRNGAGSCHSYDSSQSSFGFRQSFPNYLEATKMFPDSQHDIVMSAIYSFTGVQGKYLKKDVVTGRFKLDPQNIKFLTTGQAGMLLRLSELGYYHDRVVKFSDVSTGFNAIGSMGQALISKLKEELANFHGQVAVLHDKTQRFRHDGWMSGFAYKDKDSGDELTLFKLLAWYIKPLHRMQWLTKIADACQIKKGGELASTVYDFLDNGNDMVNELVEDLLTAICGPLVRMISKWILEGGISDIHREFFVKSIKDVGVDRLWHDKFRLRLPMLPKFVPIELAKKILMTGKCINFLREICEEQGMMKKRDELMKVMESSAAHIFSYTPDTSWHAAVETCYQQTSKHVLDIMVGPHKLLDHLYGMRRYLLLGQGDFISILIENMKNELERPGLDVYANDLTSMLDSALRCTNAQYDDPDILNHLDVIVQRPFNGDIGWDIISLQYIVHGPLAAMLESTMPTYKVLFKPLWRMKHMEFVLSMKIWKEQMGNAKALRTMKSEIGKASHRLNLFTSEIMHFIHQMQYYVLFEVIECNWVELQKKMQKATTLDEILEAHEKFLQTILVGCFVSNKASVEHSLEVVYDNIIELEKWQSSFYKDCFKELSARKELSKIVEKSEEKGVYGLTNNMILQRDQEAKMFAEKMDIACRGLEVIATDYEKAVSSFLMSLNSSDDPNLQLFGTRLDFNEYYKKRDTNLSKPLTFEHMRMSNVFALNSRFVICTPSCQE
ncbi:gamma-tubulin complex component 3 isoform X1 [Drosophila sechellia]|uniref:GM17594 n=1 Tax=Drosophila sechellia TaxID=7238 RepID=B4IG60_DROSE|nr:gamma-tubulin complex component 3 isoform X1 [Drosophila sechellia]EDW48794.1 GM17594 [Drosophila sechellia]